MLSFRFGIEMVPLDQEDQSQEEEDIPLLEGFHWDSLVDMSASGASRKRSLSESSLATASSHSVFTSLMSQETAQKEGLSSEQQGSSENNDNQSTQELEQMSGQHEAGAQKQPDSLTTATALQHSDPVLVDSSSGTEQYDGQGTGKRRRAARVRCVMAPHLDAYSRSVNQWRHWFDFVVFSLPSRMFQMRRLLVWSTTIKGGRSNPKKVGAGFIMTGEKLQVVLQFVLMVPIIITLCRALTDRPAAGRVSAGGGAEPLPADCGHQPDPGPDRAAGRLHGGAAPHGG